MDIKMLDTKGIKNGIKRGLTVGDFCDKFNCTPDELETRIGNLYSHNSSKAKSYMTEIEANSKKARPKKAEPENQVEDEEVIAIDETDVAGDDSAEPAPDAETVVSEQATELEGLKRSEESLSREVMDLETEHESFSKQHKGCLAELRVLRDEIEQIEKEYEIKCGKCDLIIQENNAYVEQMNDITVKLREKRAVLDETRHKIAGLNTLIMFVYSGGEIYINDSRVDEGIVLDEELYKELRDRPECDELKQREIKTLAKVITFARKSTITIEVTCENEDLEIAYLELT